MKPTVMALAISLSIVSCSGGNGNTTNTSVEVAPSSTSGPTTTVSIPPTTPVSSTTLTVPDITEPAVPDLPEEIEVEEIGLSALQAKVQDLPEAPNGYEWAAAIAYNGYGSFSLLVPSGWPSWMLDSDFESFGEAISAKDEAWATTFLDRLKITNEIAERGEDRATAIAPVRFAAIDPKANGLAVVVVSMSDGSGLAPDELADSLASGLEASGGTVGLVEESELDGGVRVEILVQFDDPGLGWVEPVVEHQLYVLDTSNQLLWSVTCNLHLSIAESYLETCLTVQRTFSPYGRVVEDQGSG